VIRGLPPLSQNQSVLLGHIVIHESTLIECAPSLASPAEILRMRSSSTRKPRCRRTIAKVVSLLVGWPVANRVISETHPDEMPGGTRHNKLLHLVHSAAA
jgi:hypothetical protein